MVIDKDLIKRLMLEKTVGIISPENDNLLSGLLTEDPTLQRELISLQREYANSPGIRNFDVETGYDDVLREVRLRKKHKRGMMALCVVIAAAVIWTFISRVIPYERLTAEQPATVAAVMPVNSKKMLLQTADGKVVDVAATTQVNAGGARLSNNTSSRTLSYTVNDPSAAGSGINKLWVPVGMDYHLVLSDGTEVFLNSATSIEFPFRFEGNTRTVKVHGEAFFKVVGNDSQPFIVLTELGTVRVLGTEFNINDYGSRNKVVVTLTEGAVAFEGTANSDRLRLNKGEALEYSEEKGLKKKTLNGDDLLWLKGQYRLDNTPLSEIGPLFGRWFGIENVVFDKSSIAKERFTGTIMKNEPAEDFLRTLELASGITHYYKDGVLHLK